jgi:hypothetical protein
VSPGWRYIHTHFGIGYRFAAEPADAVAEAEREVAMTTATPPPSGAAVEGPVTEAEHAAVGA